MRRSWTGRGGHLNVSDHSVVKVCFVTHDRMISVRELTKLYGDSHRPYAGCRSDRDGRSARAGRSERCGQDDPRCAVWRASFLRHGNGVVAGHDIATPIQFPPSGRSRSSPTSRISSRSSRSRKHLRFIARLYGVADVESRIPVLLDELELDGKTGALPGELFARDAAEVGPSRAGSCTRRRRSFSTTAHRARSGRHAPDARGRITARAAAAVRGNLELAPPHSFWEGVFVCTKLLVVRRAKASRTERSTRSWRAPGLARTVAEMSFWR